MSWVAEQRRTPTLRGLGGDMADRSEEGTNGVWYWGKVCGERTERVDGMMRCPKGCVYDFICLLSGVRFTRKLRI